ncbi:hypothetical protein VF12_39995, partial [Nostoc linckia z15]
MFRAYSVGHWAWGIGHWALGIGHWAWGMGHWGWEEDKVDKVDKVAIFLSEVLMVGNLRSDFSPCLPPLPISPLSP